MRSAIMFYFSVEVVPTHDEEAIRLGYNQDAEEVLARRREFFRPPRGRNCVSLNVYPKPCTALLMFDGQLSSCGRDRVSASLEFVCREGERFEMRPV
jgi:hypothetical protein